MKRGKLHKNVIKNDIEEGLLGIPILLIQLAHEESLKSVHLLFYLTVVRVK